MNDVSDNYKSAIVNLREEGRKVSYGGCDCIVEQEEQEEGKEGQKGK